MKTFDDQRFLGMLRALPEVQRAEPARHSEYLQKQVFDQLNERGMFNLGALDFQAFSLQEATPGDYESLNERLNREYLMGLNKMLRGIPAASMQKRTFSKE